MQIQFVLLTCKNVHTKGSADVRNAHVKDQLLGDEREANVMDNDVANTNDGQVGHGAASRH